MKKWAFLAGAVIVTIIVLADARSLGFLQAVYDFPNGDKVGHFLLFGLLSLAMNLAVLESRAGGEAGRTVLFSSTLLAVGIAAEEFSQKWFPARTFSLLDLAASYAGVAAFAWLALWIARRKRTTLAQREP